MSVRTKMKLNSITDFGNDNKEYAFFCVYDEKLIKEDVTFSNLTPNGEFKVTVNNPAVHDQMEVGKVYYFDITEAVIEHPKG